MIDFRFLLYNNTFLIWIKKKPPLFRFIYNYRHYSPFENRVIFFCDHQLFFICFFTCFFLWFFVLNYNLIDSLQLQQWKKFIINTIWSNSRHIIIPFIIIIISSSIMWLVAAGVCSGKSSRIWSKIKSLQLILTAYWTA